MSKKIVFSKEARTLLASGVDQLANAVTSTLGPSGRNVILEQDMGNPISTKDGVTVARAIELKDKVENLGAQIVKQASIKTADQAGDGTTTSTLLAQSILNEGLERMSAGSNAVDIKRGIDLAVKDITGYLAVESKEITNEDQLKQVATISANNDQEVGELISTAMDKVGTEGVVAIEESKTGETYLETVEGMQFNRGYKSPYFVTDNNSMQSVLSDPFILITDKKLSQVKELLPLLEAISQQNKPLLIIADDVSGEALSTMVVNKMRGILPCVAVGAPEYGDRRKAMLDDLAILTGGQVISSEKGMRLDKFDTKWLGKANKVTVGKELTTIVDAKGDQETIVQRVEEIKTQIEETNSPYEKEKLQERLAKFVGGVAIVHVGGHTEVEMKEKKDRVDDALHATRAAIEEGIVAGGGVALLNSKNDLSKVKASNSDESTGIQIVIKAIESPLRTIVENSGGEGSVVVSKVLEGEKNFGYDAKEGKYVDMLKEGIIDPKKVTRVALENAASVAGMILTTECALVDIKEDNPAPMPPMGGGGMPGMM